jgi:hypothetical protein
VINKNSLHVSEKKRGGCGVAQVVEHPPSKLARYYEPSKYLLGIEDCKPGLFLFYFASPPALFLGPEGRDSCYEVPFLALSYIFPMSPLLFFNPTYPYLEHFK